MTELTIDAVVNGLQVEFWKLHSLLHRGPIDGNFWENASRDIRSVDWIETYLANFSQENLETIAPTQSKKLWIKAKHDPVAYRRLLALHLAKKLEPNTRRGKRMEEKTDGIACLHFNLKVLAPLTKVVPPVTLKIAEGPTGVDQLLLRRSREPRVFELILKLPGAHEVILTGTYDDAVRWLGQMMRS